MRNIIFIFMPVFRFDDVTNQIIPTADLYLTCPIIQEYSCHTNVQVLNTKFREKNDEIYQQQLATCTVAATLVRKNFIEFLGVRRVKKNIRNFKKLLVGMKNVQKGLIYNNIYLYRNTIGKIYVMDNLNPNGQSVRTIY